MSKEVAAAILTRIYYEHTPGAKQQLQAHKEKFFENSDIIGRIYARFLGRHDTYELWASQKIK